MTLTFPHLWVPKLWTPPLVHPLQKGIRCADGKGDKATSGKLKTKACCEDCTHCDSFPTSWDVTLSGIALCTGCIQVTAGVTYFKVSGDINGNYTAVKPASESFVCHRIKDLSSPSLPYSGTGYSNSTCTTPIPGSTATGFSVVMQKISSTSMFIFVAGSISGVAQTPLFFRKTVTMAAQDCESDIISETNDFVLADCGTLVIHGRIAGYGGTFTATPTP